MAYSNSSREIGAEPGLLPERGGKWKEYERKALEIRRFAGVSLAERLDPFKLAESLKLKVVSVSQVEGLSEQARAHLMGSDQWSGGTTGWLPDGSGLIIINDRQSPGRQAATLMEEVCHSLLGHRPSSIDPTGAGGGRSYNRAIEEEAYSVGAAVLVPYRALKDLLSKGLTVTTIARHFGVTRSLIEYRMRVLELWGGPGPGRKPSDQPNRGLDFAELKTNEADDD
ncbi:MAG TPA: ImmA/IrrE family metallo-endopeptidase [Blastocatellia bacterium]|nr:ImmA/IrrE family metallo-endopeptidase [Blastocatellia bacterium]